MKVILLAAGYATRLYPLTLNCPKPLLPIAGCPMLEHILRALQRLQTIEEVIVVTNSKFASHFQAWAQKFDSLWNGKKVTIVDDLTTDDTNKRGAVGDIHFVLNQLNITEDILVLAGDNLFEKDLGSFWQVCQQRQTAPVVGVYDVGSLDLVKKYSSVCVDEEGRITAFEEKPAHPQSTWSAIALYYYPASSLHWIQQYIDEGNNPDQPGRLVAWLYSRTPIYTWQVDGFWYDIGSKESLEEANRVFARFQK